MRTLLVLLVSATACASPPPEPAPTPEPTPAPAPEPTPAPEGLHFVDGAQDAALGIRNHSGASKERWMPEVMGTGVAAADFNRDGAPDLYFVDGGRIDGERPRGARDRLLLNDGAGRFADVTDAWGLTSRGYGQGVAVGDVDNDGYPDLYLTDWEDQDRLLRNTGSGFEDITARSGIAPPKAWSSSAAFLDADGDGNLDLYVTYYTRYDRDTAVPCFMGGIRTYCSPAQFEPLPDRLLRGLGDGTFEDRTGDWLEPHAVRSLAVAAGDIDLDGDVDLYVAADITRNLLLVNDGSGRMVERGRPAGVALSEVGKEEAGMGADFSDYDADGRLDIAVSNFQDETTALYTQLEPGFFSELSDARGIGATARARLSFGLDFFDADNDGDEDLITANGHIEPEVGRRRSGVGFAQRNTLYENVGGRFVDRTEDAGPALEAVAVSRGLITSDLDGDGDLDFVVTNRDAPAQLGRNETRGGRSLSLLLEGTESNRSAIGAVVTATIGGRARAAQVMGGQSYLSVSDFRVHLGLGDAERVDSLTIRWPRGEPQTFTDLPPGFLHVVQGAEPVPYTPGERVLSP